MEQQQQQQPPKRQRSSQQQGAVQPALPCARCGSGDTKFCYYNNYNTSQPRHYCRTCKRHWTQGGTLRNVPEGGSSKKTKKKPSTSSSFSSSSFKLPQPQFLHGQTPVMTAGIGNLDHGPVPAPAFFYGGGSDGRAGRGVIGDELGFINPGGILGDFSEANPTLAPLPRFNPLDGINLQQLVQQPRLSLALHQNLFMFQQQQGNWRQNYPTTPFTTAAPSSIASSTGAAGTGEEINRRNNNIFNLPPPPPPPPPSSSFM